MREMEVTDYALRITPPASRKRRLVLARLQLRNLHHDFAGVLLINLLESLFRSGICISMWYLYK